MITPPPHRPHSRLNRRPDPLDDFPILPPTSALDALFLVPSGDGEGDHAAAPFFDGFGDGIARHADVDADGVLEEFRRMGPLVVLELPCLAGGEDRDEALPVVGLEVGRVVDEDEAGGFAGGRTTGGGG